MIMYNFETVDLYVKNKNAERPVVAIYDSGHGKMCRFKSIRDAARIMCIPQSNIVACLKGRKKTAGGCVWKYADEKQEGKK